MFFFKKKRNVPNRSERRETQKTLVGEQITNTPKIKSQLEFRNATTNGTYTSSKKNGKNELEDSVTEQEDRSERRR